MKTAKLKNGLICVSVPSEAINFNLYNKNTLRFQIGIIPTYENLEEMNYEYQILGTITASGFEGDLATILGNGIPHNNLKMMIENETDFLFENNKPHTSDINPTSKRHYDKITEEWEQAQSRIIEKLLILKTI